MDTIKSWASKTIKYLTNQTQNHIDMEQKEVDDVLQVVEMLTQTGRYEQSRVLCPIPLDIVINILEFANYTASITGENAQSFREVNANHNYLSIKAPTGTSPITGEPFKITKIAFEVSSHDQGWSDVREHHGTYNGSYTYGEISLLRNNEEVGNRTRCYTNLTATSSWQLHKKDFFMDSDFIKSIQPGDEIAVFLRSEYPGWCNFTNFASIKLFYI
ncbi:hypothetical protein AKO1_008827 [Acrasis kona]|uniref:Uncharacterized protein n=1 Tax=Acrasis kona TaxID=1008807 RepID=A0AAW2ZFW8_9EUKA